MMTERPKTLNAVLVCISAVLLGGASVGVMSRLDLVLLSIFTIPAFCAALSYVFTRVQSPAVILVPVVSAVWGVFTGTDPFLTVAAVSFATVAAAVFAVMTLNRTEPFNTLLVQVMLYSAYWGGLILAFLVKYFGSLKSGFEALGELAKQALSETLRLAGVGENFGGVEMAALFDAFEDVYLILPSVIVCGGIVSAWLAKGVLRLICSANGDAPTVFYAPAAAPRGLAVIYILCTVMGVLTDSGGQLYFTLSNLSTALMLLFAFEGVREFFSSIGTQGLKRGRVTLVIFAVYSIFIMPAMILVIAAYYGAFRAIFRKNDKISQGKGEARQ